MVAPGESVAAPQHNHDDDEDSEEGGGSSDEEIPDDEDSHTRTAPTTPAANTVDHNPLEHDHIHAEESGPQSMKAETLPAYVGNGVSAPEKAALTTENKSAPPPILGEPLATSSNTGDHHTEHRVESTSETTA
jgi:hypothetical protein